jgi:hypothetical protein
MIQRLREYFNIKENETLDSVILSNEYKHLSSEYRSSVQKMSDLLHTDFYELGKSSLQYDKQSILDLMPLQSKECVISEFMFTIENDLLKCNYILKEDSVLMRCYSVWTFESNTLKLLQFHSHYI